MISMVNQPMNFTDGYSPRTLGENTVNPLFSLLEADARQNTRIVHPQRRAVFNAMVRNLAEKGIIDYDDPVAMFEKRGHSRRDASNLANMMEVMSENAYRVCEGMVKPWLLQNSTFAVNEDTLTTNVAAFTRASMGMVASVFPQSIIPELFAVQTISQPTAYIFYKTIIRKSGDNAGEDISDPDYKTSTYAAPYAAADTEALTTYVKEVGVNITQESVEAEVRKIKWSSSLESIFTLQSYHGMSMEALNDDAMRTELALEVDKEVFDEVLGSAGIFSHTWDPTDGGNYSSYSPSEKKAYDQTLFDTITDAKISISGARYIDQKRIWIAGNSAAIGRLRKAGENFFIPIPGTNDGTTSIGSLAGTLNSQNRVYEVPWMDDDTFLLGYRGTDFADAGYIFAPFIPFFVGPVQWDDSMNFVVKKGALTWYATKMAVPTMYAKVTVTSS